MNSLAVALVVIFVLYLIDKHNLWRKTFKIAAWSAAVLGTIAVLAAGCFYLWSEYQDWQRERYLNAHWKLKERVMTRYVTADKTVLPRICSDQEFRELTSGEQEEVANELSSQHGMGMDVFDILAAFEKCGAYQKPAWRQ